MGDGRRIWLLCPAVVLFIADAGLTLAGQPASYWAGNYASAIEGNPLVRPLLAHSPGSFVMVATTWLTVFSAVILWWPAGAWGWRIAVVVAVAHAVGSASWLVRSGGWGWLVAAAYLAVMAELSWWCWRYVGDVRLGSRSA